MESTLDKEIQKKSSLIVAHVAKNSGVDAKSVEKVLLALGLTQALENRKRVSATAARFGTKAYGLNEVSANLARLAVSDVPI